MQLPSFSFVVFDTETTGFTPKVNRIIEFASMRVEGGKIVDCHEQLLSIEERVPPEIQVLTRITTESLEGQPTMDKCREEIHNHLGENTILVGQNVPFDIGMLKGEGINLEERPSIDTAMLASLVFPELKSYSLGYVSTVLKLHHEPKHRALGDVRATLELFSACWERLLQLPESELNFLKDIFSKSESEGCQILGKSLPSASKAKKPTWLTLPLAPNINSEKLNEEVNLQKPSVGNVEILREPVAPFTLQKILISAAKNKKETHWIAVKNLEAVVNNINIPDDVRVLYPPFLLLDPVSQKKFLAQDSFTYDETLLAVKLLWYKPHSSGQLALHGAEQSVWSAKIACTDNSEAYKKQFNNLPSVILLDHKQLLSFLADPEHTAHGALSEESHIIIDDASMLEDTATRAYGWYCALDTLRAGADGNAELTGFTDVLSIWIERTRNSQDIRYLTPPDLTHPDTIRLRDRADDLLIQDNLSSSVKQIISHALSILNPDNLGGRIAFIEQRFNGSLVLQSVPEYLGDFLQKTLYEKFCVSLILPPAKNTRLAEILPENVAQSHRNISSETTPFEILIDEDSSIKEIFENPPEGKTILLATSKRSIDDAFMRHSISMEKRGVTLICQGFSGGINRTRAEFLESNGIVIWMLTPWAYEGVYLPENSADRLLFTGLPFDHPSHAILSKRSEHFRDPFNEYSLPRMLSRVFRLLRTFSSHCKKGSKVHFLDQRINTKRYGNDVKKYLSEIVSETEEDVSEEDAGDQMKML